MMALRSKSDFISLGSSDYDLITSLRGCGAAVYGQLIASDKGGLIRGQKQDTIRDIINCAGYA